MSSNGHSSDVAIRAIGLGKCYHIYAKPSDRLRQLLWRGRRSFYREFWANRDISFDVHRGETVGIVGRNGAGKTTLLKMLAGTLTPTRGRAEINGRATALLELGSGFNPEFTGRENVFLNGAVLGISRKEMEQRFDRIEAFADIGTWIDQPMKTYSKGMACRLGFSVLANLDPDLFIVDEALAVGDAQFRHRCMLRFNEMKENGTTILYVSHDARTMKRQCNRVVWLDGGCIRQIGPSKDVVDAYLEALFHGNGKVVERPAPEAASALAAPQPKAGPDWPRHESVIPNIDRRIGDGSCTIMGVGLYNAAGKRLPHVSGSEEIVLRVTIRNESLDPDADAIQTGWILRNAKYQEIAATNTGTEGVELPLPNPGEMITVAHKIHLPCLKPGSYSFTVGASFLDDTGGPVAADRIFNATVLDVTTAKRVHGLIAFDTEVDVTT